MRVIAVLLDAHSFGAPLSRLPHLQQMAEAAGLTMYVIRQDDDLTSALSYRMGRYRPLN
jgi:hypothetical protein